MTPHLPRLLRWPTSGGLVLPALFLVFSPAHAQSQQAIAALNLPASPVAATSVHPQASDPVNPVTGERLEAEALRVRLARLQVQSRIEAELTAIERSRQERLHLLAPDTRTALPAFFSHPSRSLAGVDPASGGAISSDFAGSARLAHHSSGARASQRPAPSTGTSAATMPASSAPGTANTTTTSRNGAGPSGAPAMPPPRLVAIVQDGMNRVGLAETGTGLLPVAAQPDVHGDDTFALDGRDLRLSQEPGHIELPRAPVREPRDAAIAGPAAGALGMTDDPLAAMRAGAQRLGIVLPATGHEGNP